MAVKSLQELNREFKTGVKSLAELNREFNSTALKSEKRKKNKRIMPVLISDLLFFLGIFTFVLSMAGMAINNFKANNQILIIIFGLCVLVSFLIRGLFAKPNKKQIKKRGNNDV